MEETTVVGSTHRRKSTLQVNTRNCKWYPLPGSSVLSKQFQAIESHLQAVFPSTVVPNKEGKPASSKHVWRTLDFYSQNKKKVERWNSRADWSHMLPLWRAHFQVPYEPFRASLVNIKSPTKNIFLLGGFSAHLTNTADFSNVSYISQPLSLQREITHFPNYNCKYQALPV